MQNLSDLFKALSDETRIRLLLALHRSEHCVCELTEILGLSQPKISKHLTKLRDLGFVETKKDAQYVFYYLNSKHEVLNNIMDVLSKRLDQYPVLLADSLRKPSCLIRASRQSPKGSQTL